jgi:pimeloyl-ACP methyl ester carboxylesterase
VATLRTLDLTIDVSDGVDVGEPLHTRVTVVIPSPDVRADPPVVCFGFPGYGYSRGYFTFDMPDSNDGGEAGWHASRGWIFVACDHLCVGESSVPTNAGALTIDLLAAANHATVTEVLRLLAAGALTDDLPPVGDPVVLGVGQSMGGCLTVVQQAHHATFDGIGVLGFSAFHTVMWTPPGTPDIGVAYFVRNSRAVVTSPGAGVFAPVPDESGLSSLVAGFHYDDVPREIVLADMVDYPTRQGSVPPWASATGPACSIWMASPGVIAPEAAVIVVPVFVAAGERDVVPSPRDEPRAYQRSPDITVVVCPQMAHMHNMASTRVQLWQRLHAWGAGVVATR